MAKYLKNLWRRLFSDDSQAKAETEVTRIAIAQQAAVRRRAEYAAAQEQAAQAGTTSPPPEALSSSRKRVEEAEAAYSLALQKWDNKQSRQKSR